MVLYTHPTVLLLSKSVRTLRMMSPSCRFPSLAASPVLVICLMKIWLPRRRPYSMKPQTDKAPQLLQNHAAIMEDTVVWVYFFS